MGQKINPIGLRLGINRGWDQLGLQKKTLADILLRTLKFVII